MLLLAILTVGQAFDPASLNHANLTSQYSIRAELTIESGRMSERRVDPDKLFREGIAAFELKKSECVNVTWETDGLAVRTLVTGMFPSVEMTGEFREREFVVDHRHLLSVKPIAKMRCAVMQDRPEVEGWLRHSSLGPFWWFDERWLDPQTSGTKGMVYVEKPKEWNGAKVLHFASSTPSAKIDYFFDSENTPLPVYARRLIPHSGIGEYSVQELYVRSRARVGASARPFPLESFVVYSRVKGSLPAVTAEFAAPVPYDSVIPPKVRRIRTVRTSDKPDLTLRAGPIDGYVSFYDGLKKISPSLARMSIADAERFVGTDWVVDKSKLPALASAEEIRTLEGALEPEKRSWIYRWLYIVAGLLAILAVGLLVRRWRGSSR